MINSTIPKQKRWKSNSNQILHKS